jgi:hypothetical protein
MVNPFNHFWFFVYAVGDHAVTLAAGCVLTVVVNLVEKYAMGGKRLPLKVDVAILLVFIFFACFQAWRDEYDKANKIVSAPTVQVTIPPIVVPPAQVVVAPAPPAVVQSSALTGFMELARTDVVTKKIAIASPVEVNVGYVVKGTQPVSNAKYVTASALASLNPDHKEWDEKTEKENEEQIWKVFTASAIGQVKHEKKFKGHTIGVGNVITFTTATSTPLTEPQVEGIMDGRTRLYLLSWATWKDSNNRIGDTHQCLWMQNPTSLDLSNQQIVWHGCTWVP